MKPRNRIGRAIVLGGLLATACAIRIPGRFGPGAAAGVVAIAAWVVARNLYFERFEVTFNDEHRLMVKSGQGVIRLEWATLVHTQVLHPSFLGFSAFLGSRATPTSGLPPARYKPPLGYEIRNQLRRLITLSPDLLLLSRSGIHAFVPLSALTTQESLDLFARLAPVAPNVTNLPAKFVDAAMKCEGQAQELMVRHEWGNAVPLYREAAENWLRAGRVDQLRRVYENMAECLHRTGNYTEAAGVLQRSLELCLNLKDLPGEANVRNGIARIEWTLGDRNGIESALTHLQRAQQIHHDLGDVFFEARMLGNMAVNYQRLYFLRRDARDEEPGQALNDCEQRAIDGLKVLMKRQNAVSSEEVDGQRANLEGTLAHCHFARGQWRQSAEMFAKANATIGARAILTDKATWAHALFQQSRDASAGTGEQRRLVHQATELLDSAVSSIPASGDHNEAMEILATRGDIYWQMNRWQEAARDYESVLDLIEERAFGFSRPNERIALRRRFHTLYPRAVEANIRLALADPAGGAEYVASAFLFSERFKASSLAEMTATQEGISNLPEALRTELLEAQTQQRRVHISYEEDRRSSDPDVRAVSWTLLQEAEDRLRRAMEAVVRHAPAMAHGTHRQVASFDDVVNALPDDNTAVLQFSLCEGGLAVFLLSRRVPEQEAYWWIPSFTKERWPPALWSFTEAYKRYVEAAAQHKPFLRNLRANWVRRLDKVVASVEMDIFTAPSNQKKDIRQRLETLDLSRLAIVPEGILNRLPLHVGAPRGVRVTFAPSSFMLLRAASLGGPELTEMLIVDDPGRGLDRALPGAGIEGEIVAQRATAAGIRVTRLSGPAACSDRILKEMLKVTWLHYAGHAFSDRQNPWDSWLDAVDKKLTAGLLLREGTLKTGSVIVVNGCSSGVAPPDQGGEFSGLPAAFLALGCSQVVSTLWEVMGGPPAALMDRFYVRFATGDFTVAAAMGEIVDEFRKWSLADTAAWERSHHLATGEVFDPEETRRLPPSHPIHWAAYVIWGAAWRSPEPWVAARGRGTDMRKAATISLSSGQSSQERKDKLNESVRLFERKQFAEALVLDEECLRRWGRNRSVLSRLGTIHTEMGHPELALPMDEEALAMDPNSPPLYYALGCVHMDLGNVVRARDYLRKTLELDPGYWKALCNLGVLENDPAQTLAHLRAASEIAPDEEDTRAGVAHWERVCADPGFEIAGYRLAGAWRMVEEKNWKHVRLELALLRELSLTPEQKALMETTASEMFRQQGQLRESVEHLEASARLNPTVPFVWNTLSARRYLLALDPATPLSERSGLLQAAVSAGQNACRVGDYSMPRRNSATAYLALGDLRTARREAEIAVDMATRQIAKGPAGPLICGGCPTRGQDPAKCQECLRAAETLRRDIDLTGGNYHV
jgi:tetratricopeptide (TPR) repeat protein